MTEATNHIAGGAMRGYDQGEPWFKECQGCGAPSLYGNRYCDPCAFEVSGGPDADCPQCGRQSEHPGWLCSSCAEGWRHYRGDLFDEALREAIEKEDR